MFVFTEKLRKNYSGDRVKFESINLETDEVTPILTNGKEVLFIVSTIAPSDYPERKTVEWKLRVGKGGCSRSLSRGIKLRVTVDGVVVDEFLREDFLED